MFLEGAYLAFLKKIVLLVLIKIFHEKISCSSSVWIPQNIFSISHRSVAAFSEKKNKSLLPDWPTLWILLSYWWKMILKQWPFVASCPHVMKKQTLQYLVSLYSVCELQSLKWMGRLISTNKMKEFFSIDH